MTKMEKELIEKLERTCQTEARVTLRLIRKLQKENTELKEELDYYKQKESQDFDERDYYEE